MSPLLAATVGTGLSLDLGAEPVKDAWVLTMQADFLTTAFSDALYIDSRQGALGVVQLEAVF